MWEPQYKIIKFQKMPEQYFLPWFWNAKKKTCSSQHTSNKPRKWETVAPKRLFNYKVPLDNKIYSSKKKTVYEKVFLIGFAFVKYVLHVYPI